MVKHHQQKKVPFHKTRYKRHLLIHQRIHTKQCTKPGEKKHRKHTKKYNTKRNAITNTSHETLASKTYESQTLTHPEKSNKI